MVKPPLLNTASTFHFLPFVILNLLLLIANVPEYFRIFFFCLLLPLVSRSKLPVFHRPRVSFLCAACNSEFSFHLIFNFTKVLLFFPGVLVVVLTSASLLSLMQESLSSGGAFPTILRLPQSPVIRCTNFHPFVPVVALPRLLQYRS